VNFKIKLKKMENARTVKEFPENNNLTAMDIPHLNIEI